MIYKGLNRIGMIGDIKTNGGGEIAEVYGGIGESDPIYFKQREIVGTSPMQFKALGLPLKDYRIYGETLQDGTPSPDMPVDVVGCGARTGNLWNEDYIGINTDVVYRPLFVGDGVFTLSTDFERNGNITDIFLLSGNVSSGISSDANGAYQGRNITARSVNGYITIAYRANARTGSDSLPYCKTMLNLGSTALPYEPYGYKLPVTTTNGTDTVSTPIYIGSEPLHRIGEYADYVGYSSGKIMRRIKKLVLTGEENWAHDNVGTRNYIIINDAYAKGNRLTQCYCSHYTCVYNMEPFDDIPNDSIYINLFNNRARFFIKTEEYQTADSFKSYLAAQYTAGTPVTVWYVLSEPIEEDPPVSFPEFTTLSGTNTLTVDTTIKPSEIDLTGRIKTSGYGQLLDKNSTAINDSTGTPIFIRG